MSTKFTKFSHVHLDLPDSHALYLTQAMGKFQSRMIAWLLDKLAEDGFTLLTASQLGFLGALDCGPNHASNLARGLGISRQAVHKTVRELEKSGWLETRLDEDLRNQKVIVFTTEGERMMSSARKHFLKLDEVLLSQFDEETLLTLHRFLDFDPGSQAQEYPC